MKKFLLAVAFASAGMLAANAGKVAIIVENEPYYDDCDELVTIRIGDENPKLISNAFTWNFYKVKESTNQAAQVNCTFHWQTNSAATLTAAPGCTITRIDMYTPASTGKKGTGPETYDYAALPNDQFTLGENGVLTWTGSLAPGQSMDMHPSAQTRFAVVEVTYTGKPELPLMPYANYESTVLTENDKIELTTEQSGCQIYYTTDGSDADASSILYTGPISLTRGIQHINAVAVNDGKVSPQYRNTYVVAEAGLEVAIYDFRSIEDLTLKNKEWPATATNSAYNITLIDEVLTNGEVMMECFLGTAPKNYPRMAMSTNGGFIELRTYTGNTVVFCVPDNYYIGTILIAGSGMKSYTEAPKEVNGGWSKGGFNTSYILWQANDRTTQAIEFEALADGTNYFDMVYVAYAPMTNAGVEAIEVDYSNALVVYYNLQGMQVKAENITSGIYIKRQGPKAEKVYIK